MNLRALFDAVAELPSRDQRAALRDLTDDNDLIEKVLRMCVQDKLTDAKIAVAISRNVESLTAKLGNELNLGDTLDTWRLVEEIGQGGMGKVFLAERADGHFRQSVAVKVMHGMATQAATARLAQERQILAGLTHPNIARLLDGGATPDGQPYLVMEYIEGIPIDEFCIAKKASFITVLELMMPICDAVAVAHQRLIVHCDIKPSNILVTEAKRPSLLDFGIASLLSEGTILPASEIESETVVPGLRAVDRANLPKTTIVRMRGSTAVAYTPRYASPEQKAGKALTTATDIFSLGRVLDELCALDPLFKSGVAKGSTGLQVREVHAIIAKATNEVPAARYGSALNMALDIKNVLRGAKVEAAANLTAYAGRKWLSQHLVETAALIAFVAMGSAFTIRLINERGNALEAAASAIAERDNAASANRFANKARIDAEIAQRASELSKEDSETQRYIAELALKSAEAARKQALADRDLANDLQKTANQFSENLITIIDSVNPGRGGDRNISMREAISKAEEKISALESTGGDAQAKLLLSLAQIQLSLGDPRRAVAYYNRAAQSYAQAGAKFLPQQVAALTDIAILQRNEDIAGGMETAQEAVRLGKKIQQQDPITYALALNALINNFQNHSRYVEAKKYIDEAEKIMRENLANPWADARYLRFQNAVAQNLRLTENYFEAETLFRKILLHRKALPESQARAIADTHTMIAVTLQSQGKNDAAEIEHKQALMISLDKLGEDSAQYGYSLSQYAVFLRRVKRLDEAATAFDKADTLSIKKNANGLPNPTLLVTRATLLVDRDDILGAIALLQRAAKIFEDEFGEADIKRLQALSRMVYLHLRLKNLSEARSMAEQSLILRQRAYKNNEAPVIAGLRTMADVELAEGKTLQAISTLDKIIGNFGEVGVAVKQGIHTDIARAWQRYGDELLASQSGGARDIAKLIDAKEKATFHAQAAREISLATRGEQSNEYKTLSALLETLKKPSF